MNVLLHRCILYLNLHGEFDLRYTTGLPLLNVIFYFDTHEFFKMSFLESHPHNSVAYDRIDFKTILYNSGNLFTVRSYERGLSNW